MCKAGLGRRCQFVHETGFWLAQSMHLGRLSTLSYLGLGVLG